MTVYRHQMTAQRQTKTKDTMGGYTDAWTDLITRRCEITNVNGTETWARSGQFADVTAQIKMRNDALVKTIRAYDRLLDEQTSPRTIYEIISVFTTDPARREVTFLCKRDG